MLTATQPLAAAHTQSHGPSSLTSTVPSGRWVSPVPRRRQTRRTASKISCRSSSAAEGNGEAGVVTIGRPEPARVKEQETTVALKALVTVHMKSEPDLISKMIELATKNWLSIELVSTELNPETGLEWGTASRKATYRGGLNHHYTFEAIFNVPASFGTVGAVRLDNDYRQEMFIKEIMVFPDGDESRAVNFYCESWVVDNEQCGNDDRRTFFPLKSYLPSQTPKGVQWLRKTELEAIRGNGCGERKPIERIYDYDVYNDLGTPEAKRPVLGGKEHPYPRRCRTGRLRSTTDPASESRTKDPQDIYVPRDEAFSERKQLAFDTKKTLAGLHALIGGKKNEHHKELSFPSLAAIDSIYEDGFMNMPPPKEGGGVMDFAFKVIRTELVNLLRGDLAAMKDEIDKIFKFETPEIHNKDKFAWFRDEEFARETLAGMNPMSIQLVTELPIVSQLDDEIQYGPKESLLNETLINEQLNGVMTAKEIMYVYILERQMLATTPEAVQNKKLFMLDYHDALMPYVNKVRSVEGTTLYGSRTLFFLTKDGTLKPIAIELSRPKTESGKLPWRDVFKPDGSVTGSWLWQLAKTHVLAHDTGYHQLVNHWLRTHCCVEPYIIAANRQLSQMHPIYRLLHPHFRYTMEINALARGMLINADGIIETNFAPREYCIELSSAVYKDFWRFDMEALPNDLIRRGMAVHGKDGKLELTIEDYPYANDGLLIWDAIKEWVSDYVKHYYSSVEDIINDEELQDWWDEVRTKGHEDKKDEPWWPKLDSHESLVQVLTTIMWITSGHHAAVNFGQYPYAGYIPNRPTIARQNIPKEMGRQAMKKFMEDPEKVFLDTLPSQFQSFVVLVILDLLSSHSPDEEYMGTHVEPAWTVEGNVKLAFQKFQGRLRDILEQVDEWNEDPKRKNRHGAGVVPYTLLRPCDGDPFDEKSEMEMGIPNSISI
ncbi:hypothetical protein EJB05_41566 [Eragrostis curvula]|uniref:Lipoxygenase n=1 Tax=Eragrostis curvula TaxID=38414 RepID=A0A5J9T9V0_9POAL|nr:hypothetical protein EJB05_41566 [Eragrostis curvula]